MTPARSRPPVIGLTGGIASGKSAVAERFAAHGAEVIDTDALAREVVAPGSEGLAEVVTTFGEGVLDSSGALDRAAMRARVFADDAARRRLESLLHPRIEALARDRIAASGAAYVVLVVPLLLESGWERLVDRVLVVDAPEPVQRERLRRRDGTTDDEARAILASQHDRATRLAAADDVIRNSGDLEELDTAVARLDRQYRQDG